MRCFRAGILALEERSERNLSSQASWAVVLELIDQYCHLQATLDVHCFDSPESFVR